MVSRKELIAAYNELTKTYELPDYDELNCEFEAFNFLLDTTHTPDFLLRTIRRRMVDKFYSWINYLHNFIYVNQQSMIYMNEYQHFTDEERQDIIMLINKIMFINRLSVKLDIQHEDAEDAQFIRKYYAEWLNMKEELIRVTSKNIQGWQDSMTHEEKKSKEFFSF